MAENSIYIKDYKLEDARIIYCADNIYTKIDLSNTYNDIYNIIKDSESMSARAPENKITDYCHYIFKLETKPYKYKNHIDDLVIDINKTTLSIKLKCETLNLIHKKYIADYGTGGKSVVDFSHYYLKNISYKFVGVNNYLNKELYILQYFKNYDKFHKYYIDSGGNSNLFILYNKSYLCAKFKYSYFALDLHSLCSDNADSCRKEGFKFITKSAYVRNNMYMVLTLSNKVDSSLDFYINNYKIYGANAYLKISFIAGDSNICGLLVNVKKELINSLITINLGISSNNSPAAGVNISIDI